MIGNEVTCIVVNLMVGSLAYTSILFLFSKFYKFLYFYVFSVSSNQNQGRSITLVLQKGSESSFLIEWFDKLVAD